MHHDHRTNLKKLREFLRLPDDQPQFDIDMAVSEIADNELRHDDVRLGEARQPLVPLGLQSGATR
jgi:anti-sigma regulatory factor (Ser/Thr protein kinase)